MKHWQTQFRCSENWVPRSWSSQTREGHFWAVNAVDKFGGGSVNLYHIWKGCSLGGHKGRSMRTNVAEGSTMNQGIVDGEG